MVARTESLRARLWLSGLVGTMAASVAVAALLGAAFERSVLGHFDRRLADELLTLAGLVTSDAGGVARMRGEPLDTRYARALSGHYWWVETAGQDYRSRSLWDSDLALSVDSGATGRLHFQSMTGPLSQSLRVASQEIRLPNVLQPVTIGVAGDATATLAEIARFRWMAGIAGALVAAALLLVFLVQVAFGLRPLREITQTLEALRNGQAHEVETDRFPGEIRPLAEELNAVLAHNERMVARARAGVGDLAHALKTPLSVLLASAQRGDSALPATVDNQVRRMRQDIDRHLAISVPADRQSRTNLAVVVDSLVRMLSSVYADRGIRFQGEVNPSLEFHGGHADLEDMLGNLLDNACKWAHGRVSIVADVAGDLLRLSVLDDGPGIPGSEKDAALRRGQRLDESTPGSGLGLSIVVALAESYGGRLILETPDRGGLSATLELPGALAPPDRRVPKRHRFID